MSETIDKLKTRLDQRRSDLLNAQKNIQAAAELLQKSRERELFLLGSIQELESVLNEEAPDADATS